MPNSAIPFVTAALVLAVVAPIAVIATRHLGALIMTSQQATVDAITAQLTKVKAEVVGTRDALLDQIKALKDEIAAGTEAAQLDLSGLETVAADLDALTPDAADLTDNVSTDLTDNAAGTITDNTGASLTDTAG